MLGPGRLVDKDTGAPFYLLALLDLDAEPLAPHYLQLDFFGHGLARDPLAPERFALFEKIGTGAALLDLRARNVLQPITTVRARLFYGHGAFSPDGAQLFATETDKARDDAGVIAVRDGRTMALLGEFPSHGVGPHDCRLIDGGATMVIANGGHPIGGAVAPSVTYVDVKSQKLLERLELDVPTVNAGHLHVARDGSLVLVSAPRDGLPDQATKQRGALSLRAPGRPLARVQQPAATVAGMLGETLSIALHEPSGVVAVTNPEGDLLTFWSVRSGELVRAMTLPAPRGVALSLDGTEFWVTIAKPPQLLRLSATTLEPLGPAYPHALASGSHIAVEDMERTT
jgi:hypothetical protein